MRFFNNYASWIKRKTTTWGFEQWYLCKASHHRHILRSTGSYRSQWCLCRWRSDDNGYCFLHIHQNLILKTNIVSQSTCRTNNETIDCQSTFLKSSAKCSAKSASYWILSVTSNFLFRTSIAYFSLYTNPLIYTISATNRFKVNWNFLSAKKPE